MKVGPPGWQPHRIVTRIDGWFVDPHDHTHIPAVVAEMMAPAMPRPSEVEVIRARMIARHRMAEQMGWLSDE